MGRNYLAHANASGDRANGCSRNCAQRLRMRAAAFGQSAFIPWINHGGSLAEPGEPPPITVAPFNSQITTCPVLKLYQRMSLLLSPLKSPVSTIVQGLAAEPGEPPPIIDVPFISQISA